VTTPRPVPSPFTPMILADLTAHLRKLKGVAHKLDIQPVRGLLEAAGAGAAAAAVVPVGDDCAAIPDGAGGHLLFAIEGLLSEFVAAEPWFAGYCAVMVNVSDVYAMGGRPVAVVDALWTSAADRAGPVWEGMATAAAKYATPIVGGHTNTRSPGGDHLAAAVLGRAGPRLLTSFDAKPGDALVVAVDLRGEWFGPYPYWNASTAAPGDRLRGDLEVLATLAEDGLCRAAKDVSMGGLVGTATMLCECSGAGLTINVSAVPTPPGVPPERWLACFPSYGFLLAVNPDDVTAVCGRFAARGIAAAAAGAFDDSRLVRLADGSGDVETFWDLGRDRFIGFGPVTGVLGVAAGASSPHNTPPGKRSSGGPS
jgi:AIR synthase-related protein